MLDVVARYYQIFRFPRVSLKLILSNNSALIRALPVYSIPAAAGLRSRTRNNLTQHKMLRKPTLTFLRPHCNPALLWSSATIHRPRIYSPLLLTWYYGSMRLARSGRMTGQMMSGRSGEFGAILKPTLLKLGGWSLVAGPSSTTWCSWIVLGVHVFNFRQNALSYMDTYYSIPLPKKEGWLTVVIIWMGLSDLTLQNTKDNFYSELLGRRLRRLVVVADSASLLY